MKIYFSAAISAGRQLVDTYKQMIEHLKQFGQVLTEHIGDIDYTKNGFPNANTVYKTDRAWLNSSDVVIADVTVASTGVGYELGVAEMQGKPVFCFFDSTKTQKISAMIEGNSSFKCFAYKNLDEYRSTINKILNELVR